MAVRGPAFTGSSVSVYSYDLLLFIPPPCIRCLGYRRV